MLRKWESFEQVHEVINDQPHLVKLEKSMQAKGTTVWENNRYLVHREPVPSDEHNFGNETEVIWLSIKARDDSARHDWREFQWIKNELCGEDWEGFELYPSEERLIDSVNQFHLWCLAPPARFPIGWWGRSVVEENTTNYGSQRKWESNMRPNDLISEEDMKKKIKAISDLINEGKDASKLTEAEVSRYVATGGE
tara:strand:+ start:1033 stop:1617 length:585 start_codon:yes stop_codon:yes gene_type:complete